MQLFDGGRVPNSRRVRIFLAEKRVDVPITAVDLGRNEHKSASFVRLNPLRHVPVLVLDDGTVLTESLAICRYFEGLHPEPSLFGKTLREQVFIEMWQRRLELELFAPIGHAFRHLHPSMATYEVPQVPAWGEVNRHRAVGFMQILDDHLTDHAFAAGDAFSVADITGLVALDFTRAAKIPVPTELAHVARWYAELSARPSARA